MHGSALGEENLRKTKEFFGWDPDKSFYIPDGVKEYAMQASDRGAKLREEWNAKFAEYQKKYPDKAKNFVISLGLSRM